MTVSNDVHLDCNWQGAFNVAPGQKGVFGYLTEWSGLGGLILAKDIVVWNPIGGTSQSLLGGQTVPCVAIIEKFGFAGEATDPIRISGFVSKENQANIRAKLSRDLVNTKIKATWTVVAYDDQSKNWYRAVELADGIKVEGTINTVDGELQVSVEGTPTRVGDELDVQIYRFTFEVVPNPRKTTQIQFSTGPNQRLVRSWGG